MDERDEHILRAWGVKIISIANWSQGLLFSTVENKSTSQASGFEQIFVIFISYKEIEEFQNSWSRASDDFEKRQALCSTKYSEWIGLSKKEINMKNEYKIYMDICKHRENGRKVLFNIPNLQTKCHLKL